MSAINIGAILLIPLLFLFVWRSHFLNTVGKFRSMTRLHADFAFRDRDVTMTSELGSMTLPWTCFIDVWETPEFFMLFLERDQFITLPSRDMSEEIRAVLCSLLPHTT